MRKMFRWAVKLLLATIPEPAVRKLLLAFSFEFRNRMSKRHASNEILAGPFKGGLARTGSWSGRQYLPAQISGSYELEAVETIASRQPFERVVDLGAAEGFYALNIVDLGFCKEMIAFEEDDLAKELLLGEAEARNLADSPTKFKVLGRATEDSLGEALEGSPNGRNLLISDIEGGEFEIFSPSIISQLQAFDLIIEVHSTEQSAINDQIEKFLPSHEVRFAKRVSLAVDAIWAIHSDLSELEAANLAHEGRAYQQGWLIATPRVLRHV